MSSHNGSPGAIFDRGRLHDHYRVLPARSDIQLHLAAFRGTQLHSRRCREDPQQRAAGPGIPGLQLGGGCWV